MDQELKSTLYRILELTEENNKYVRKLYHASQWRKWISISYWVIIIGFSLGVFYLLQPYLESLGVAYGALKAQVEQVQDVGGKLIDVLPGGE